MTTPDPASADLVTIAGTADIRERLERPAGGVLSVKLVDAGSEVLAATAVADTGGPVPFALVVDAVLVPDARDLRLWAMLRTDAGVWGTPELVTVREELLLSRVDA